MVYECHGTGWFWGINPAVALGIGSFSLSYVWGPVAGAIVGARLASYLCDPDPA